MHQNSLALSVQKQKVRKLACYLKFYVKNNSKLVFPYYCYRLKIMTQTKTVHFGIFGQFFDLLYSSLNSFVYMAVNGRGFLMSQATPIVSPFSIELWHRAPFLFCLLQQILKITASEKAKAKKLPFNKYYFLPNKIVFNSQKIFIPKSSNDSDCLMCSDNSSSNIMSSLVNHEKNNAQFVSYKQDQTGSNKFKQDYAWHIRWLELLGMLLLVFSDGLWYKDFFRGGLFSFFYLTQYPPKSCKIAILNMFSSDGGCSG